MWTPKDGAVVYWATPGTNRPAPDLPTTTFTNTGDRFPNTPEAFWARYANGNPVWIEFPSAGNPAGTRAHLLEEGDHAGQSLGAALMRAAADPKNPWGLKPEQVIGDMALLIHDFMATEIGPGREDPRVLYPTAPIAPRLPTAAAARIRQLEADLAIAQQDAAALGLKSAAVARKIGEMGTAVRKKFPTGGGGRFVAMIRELELFAKESGLLKVLLIAVLLFGLSGCAAFRALTPGGVTPAMAEWSGVKSGDPVSITASLDARAAALEPILTLLGQDDPLGVLLPVTLVGETQPRWVICDGELVTKCRAIPLNAKVHFAGSPIGPGLLWRPKRLTADDFND